MQEEDKSVDIDTSGPDVEIELPQEKKENEKEEVVVEQATEDKTNEEPETKLEDGGIAGDSSEKPVEQPVVQEDNKQKSEGKEAEDYSDGVKKRIAKLTKKCEKQKGKEKKLCVMLKALEKKEMSLKLKLIL